VLPCDSERIHLALGELGRLERLIADLGKLAALDATTARPVPVPYDLGAQVRELVALYQPALTARCLCLDVDIGAGTFPVRARADDVAEVLHNLLRNATDYARAGGSVRLRVDRTPGWVRLRIYNDVPAPVQQPERFFERFYRTDPSRARSTGGSGLGLSIVRRLVHGMGGTITLRPAGRSGVEAILRLPAGR
jgi:signal transduction histidine kinase